MSATALLGCGFVPGQAVEPAEFQLAFRSWLAENAHDLTAIREARPFSIEDRATRLRPLQHALYASGWFRWGWPELVGGFGGPPLLRGVLHEELCAAGYQLPDSVLLIEILGPMIIERSPELARRYFPAVLAGTETWSQGFSETEAGSDLAALRCRAEAVDDGYRVNGRKVWSSFGHLASRCVLLARTGSPESRHRGLSMFLMDHDTPGVTVAPIQAANGRNEFAELVFDDVLVPTSRVIGEFGAGWAAAMGLLQWERGTFAWQRQAALHTELAEALSSGSSSDTVLPAARVGAAYRTLLSLRLASRRTLRALSDGANPGPVISVDKILLGRSEHLVHELARDLRPGVFEFGDGPEADLLRAEYAYGRTASIYGGSVEMQRTILADQVLRLPREARS